MCLSRSTDEIRDFCVSNLECLKECYEVVNVMNETAYHRFINRKMTLADEFFTKLRYAASFLFKCLVAAVSLGHLIDFETYADFKKNRGIKTGNDLLTEHIKYIMDTGLLMPAAIENTVSAIQNDEEALQRYYREIVRHLDSQKIIQSHIRAMLACGADLPFEPGHFDEMFELHPNTSSEDVGDTDYISQIKRSFAEHKKRIAEAE